jgi:hypothetical protein
MKICVLNVSLLITKSEKKETFCTIKLHLLSSLLSSNDYYKYKFYEIIKFMENLGNNTNEKNIQESEVFDPKDRNRVDELNKKFGNLENSNNLLEIKHSPAELKEEGIEDFEEDLIDRVRFSQRYPSTPVIITTEQKQNIFQISRDINNELVGNYQLDFGISPCSNPNDNFYNQVWSRDGAHGISNYYAQRNPKAVTDTLETILRHQHKDGQLPLRVERVYAPLRLIPGVGVWLSKKLFDFHEKEINGRKEHAIYKGQDISGGEDTVPAVIISTGELFINSKVGKEFTAQHYNQLLQAITHFRSKVDAEDGLAILDKSPDWSETIERSGKLGTINILWARALRLMEFMSRELGHKEEAIKFKKEFLEIKESILEKLYNKEDAYFRSSVGENRVDVVASIFGSLYFLSPTEAERVQQTLKERVKHSSGLVNFDPPYPQEKVNKLVRTFGNSHYHNENVWPWVTCQNIQVKIKIALGHTDEKIRDQYKKECINDLVTVSQLFKDSGGSYEVMQPDKPEPAIGKIKLFGIIPITTYKPPKNFMASMVAYESAYQQLQKLGWV